jgi:hypothetical protein
VKCRFTFRTPNHRSGGRFGKWTKTGPQARLGSSGEWNDDDYDVVADGVVVGRNMKAAAAPVGMSWRWTLAYAYHEDRSPTHGPRQGTCVIATPVITLNNSPAKWDGVPVPADAMLISPGLALA